MLNGSERQSGAMPPDGREWRAGARAYELKELVEGDPDSVVMMPPPDPIGEDPFLDDERDLVGRVLPAVAAGLGVALIGGNGVGKTALVFHVARILGRPLWTLQCHMDIEPGDITIRPRLASDGGCRRLASPVVAALRGNGILLMDELGKVNDRTLAPLAPLDWRRYFDSDLVGRKFAASPDFAVIATVNPADLDHARREGRWLYEFIMSRLPVHIKCDRPAAEHLQKIVAARFGDSPLVDAFKCWTGAGSVTPRQAIAMIQYASARHNGGGPVSKAEALRLIADAATVIAGGAA
jgi:nitric oxide reductase NorQ protein